MFKNRENESNPSRLVRETVCRMCAAFFALLGVAAVVALVLLIVGV